VNGRPQAGGLAGFFCSSLNSCRSSNVLLCSPCHVRCVCRVCVCVCVSCVRRKLAGEEF
jgi:hypothetical protein